MAARKSTNIVKSAPTKETKLCASCGRVFAYQKRWEKTWETVRYCSRGCRQDKFEKRDVALEDSILQLLAARAKEQSKGQSKGQGKRQGKEQSVDPSQITVEAESYKNLKERIRRAARRLVAQGKIDILQKGRVVDASTAKGPIEVRLK